MQFIDKIKSKLLGAMASAFYKPMPIDTYGTQIRDLPPFTFITIRAMLWDPTIRLGLGMGAAPLCNAQFAYQEGDKWTPGIKAKNPEVAEFVLQQLQRFWKHDLPRLTKAQIWGWAGGEVTYKLNADKTRIEFDRVHTRHASDIRALELKGRLVGVRVRRAGGDGINGQVDLMGPKGFWHAYLPEDGSHYGWSATKGAYSPWADKWLDGMALDVRRLFMHQAAYGGATMWYPDGTMEIPGKGTINNVDIARQVVEQHKAGGVRTMPSQIDQATGKPLWDWKDPTVPANPQHILQFPKDLDIEMLRGLEIPDDVLTSENGGAWEGKKVPAQAFFTSLGTWGNSLLGDVITQIMEPLVYLNWGRAEEFEACLKPLGLQAGQEQDGGKQPGQQALPNPFAPIYGEGRQQMSLDPAAAVGSGVLDAADLVAAAKVAIRSRKRLSLGSHDFSSTQFNLTGDLAFGVLQLGYRIDSDDLASDGREENPHITIKYGLHTNDPEEVREVAMGLPPVAVQFGAVSFFSSDEHDVLKIDIESKGLHDLNAKLAEALDHTDTYPDYHPHLTIAYVKPGLGERYAATLNDLQGKTAVFDRLTFSDKDRNHISIPLTGEAKRFALK